MFVHKCDNSLPKVTLMRLYRIQHCVHSTLRAVITLSLSCIYTRLCRQISMPAFEFCWEKSILQVPDTSTRVLDNTRPLLRSSIVSFWIMPTCSKERKYHIFRQYLYTRNVPVFTNTGTFQYLGPEVYLFLLLICQQQKHLLIPAL